ncbi:hypothetical protein [Candidatus Entotheonella palauensis]|uniref:hypothetical protein n=1 Tax=Candidatus Entotheonella palauensis TaxID=93172 RepID=UPI000B7F7C8C|nr:hypothetical protein [Candidatus Entotheonella palauensis]
MSPPPVQRRLYMVWLVFAVLLAGIIVHEVTGIFEPAPAPHTGRLPMFEFREPELGRVEVMHQGQRTVLMRDAADAWFHHGASHDHRHEHGSSHDDHRHTDTDAAHGANLTISSIDIAERINALARMLADRRVKPEQSLDHYGLTNPQTIIMFYGRKRNNASKPLAILHVGDLLPDQYTYYARQPGNTVLSLIPRYYIALLLALAFGEDRAPTPLPVHKGKG